MTWWEILRGAAICVGVVVLGGAIGFTLSCIVDAITKRKSNGRYRKASEAHRAGASGGASAGAGYRAGYLSGGRAGASVNALNPYGPGGQHFNGIGASQSPEFSGVEFSAGVVTGARSFKVDALGRLTGINYETVWTPDEMHAKCFAMDSSSYRPDAAPKEHPLPRCTHGFYGYYDGSNDYHQPGFVSGVIEGFGEAVIGTRGFRCMKARIVARHIPEGVPRRALVVRNYAAIPQFDSFQKMLKAFPTDDAGQGISPANTPDFWTRSA